MKKLSTKLFAAVFAVLLVLVPVLSGCSVAEELLNDEEFVSMLEDAVTAEGEEDSSGEGQSDYYSYYTDADEPAEETETEQAAEASEPAAEETEEPVKAEETQSDEDSVVYGESYSDLDHVALYIHTYGELPPNYITKSEAKKLGWESSKGNLWDVAYGKSIGGDYFGNYEGKLPTASGRKYYECDIGYEGGYRGDDRIIFSNDGLVYYTGDHYNTFTLLYGEE